MALDIWNNQYQPNLNIHGRHLWLVLLIDFRTQCFLRDLNQLIDPIVLKLEMKHVSHFCNKQDTMILEPVN